MPGDTQTHSSRAAGESRSMAAQGYIVGIFPMSLSSTSDESGKALTRPPVPHPQGRWKGLPDCGLLAQNLLLLSVSPAQSVASDWRFSWKGPRAPESDGRFQDLGREGTRCFSRKPGSYQR